MRYGIFGDIEGDFTALSRVIEALKSEGVDMMLCLGDVVGVKPDGSRCIELVQKHCVACVAGEKDRFLCGNLDHTAFNRYARDVMDASRRDLTAADFEWLRRLPLEAKVGDFLLVHGSPANPENFPYVTTVDDAVDAFVTLNEPLAFIANTHLPLAWFGTKPLTYKMEKRVSTKGPHKTIINVGSVLSISKSEPKNSFVIYDDGKKMVEFRHLAVDK
jgi:predicted phosphodiesterase